MNPTTDPTLAFDAFDRNAEVNAALLDALADADLSVPDRRGGWNVGKHLGHLAEFRAGWLGFIAPAHARGIPSVVEGDEADFALTVSAVEDLAEAFRVGDAAARAAVRERLAAGGSFERVYVSHPTAFLIHTVVHDAHHRGQVLALLRAGGKPQAWLDAVDDATWSVWRR
jgi:uncharacterized damage-inducible protein DinB